MNKHNNIKLLLKFMNLLGGETGEIAKHVNFMQHMLVLYSPCRFSSPEGNIRKMSKTLTSGK